MTAAMIVEAITSIPKILDGLREIGASIDKLRDAITEKNIESIKTDVSKTLEEISNVKSNKKRQELISKLNAKLSL